MWLRTGTMSSWTARAGREVTSGSEPSLQSISMHCWPPHCSLVRSSQSLSHFVTLDALNCIRNKVIRKITCHSTRLSDFTFTFHFHSLEKEMATHSSVLAWRIPEMGEPGGLTSMGSHRVGHDWSDLAAAAATHIELTTLHNLSNSYPSRPFSPKV